MTTSIATSGSRRLEQLYELSKLFNAFASVDDTVGKALCVIAATLPLESALLIQATIACHTEITVWRCENEAPARLVAARAHAEALYAYLVGARSIDTLDLHDRVGSMTLPAPSDNRVSSEDARRFVMIPLVVGQGAMFGALHLATASALARDDVEFVNAIANQLAIALDRDRARRHDVVRRREAQLLQARYENIVDRLDASFVWEADLESHRISYVSAQFEQLLGFSRRECLDERNWWRAHAHAGDHRRLEDTFARALAARVHCRCDHRVITADKTIVWLRTSVRVTDTPGEPPRFQGLSCDITAARGEQHKISNQLGADVMCEQVIAGELTAPLAAIASASRALGHGGLAGRRRRARTVAVAKIRRAAGRMQRLVDHLQDFASSQTGGCEFAIRPQDIAAIITESTTRFERLAMARGAKLVSDTPVNMPSLHCDRDGVLHVIANLLRNALKIVGRGGQVCLRVKRSDTEVIFSVSDTGPGFALAENAYLFEPYCRGPQASYPGIGLGLAIARGIVEQHGGRIWADSELGLGTTFFFTLPLAGSRQTPFPSETPTRPIPRGYRPTDT